MPKNRDLVRHYTRAQFVAKLRRLADALEAEGSFPIQVAGERLRLEKPAVAQFVEWFTDQLVDL